MLSCFSHVWPCNLCLWYSLGKNTGMGCYAFPQGIFPTQKLKLWCPVSPELQADSILTEPPEKPYSLLPSLQNLIISHFSWITTIFFININFFLVNFAQRPPHVLLPFLVSHLFFFHACYGYHTIIYLLIYSKIVSYFFGYLVAILSYLLKIYSF